MLERMLASVALTHASKLSAICQTNLTAAGKEFSAMGPGAAVLLSMVNPLPQNRLNNSQPHELLVSMVLTQ